MLIDPKKRRVFKNKARSFTVDNNILFYKPNKFHSQSVRVVLETEQNELFNQLHTQHGHPGFNFLY